MFEILFFRRGEELRTETSMVLEAHDDCDTFLSSEDHDAMFSGAYNFYSLRCMYKRLSKLAGSSH
jgi:hypothetical protein